MPKGKTVVEYRCYVSGDVPLRAPICARSPSRHQRRLRTSGRSHLHGAPHEAGESRTFVGRMSFAFEFSSLFLQLFYNYFDVFWNLF